MIYKSVGVTNNNQSTVVLSLDSISVFLAILVALTGLATFFWKVVSNFNKIASDIRDIREDLSTHVNAEGHTGSLQHVRILQKEVAVIDKQFAVHQENYINRIATVNMLVAQLDEKINNRSERSEKMIEEVEREVKEVQGFLRKHESFVIRKRDD
ncbi:MULTISPECIES: hypothetical protein [unclassified Nostoc]|uniref:hypothetical protein n=1 Tax=unclassified Nostoc TaxID=2593658 RepID=UPI002AD34529|nr:hypothetical protein [Nostoc sp. DedQUE03]MDZ7974744.1 hypothetical protein [Nostoc sp. DedQUE03]MDZ8048057.1 hypothetical protein [Nostoc sp. DedQUE02]